MMASGEISKDWGKKLIRDIVYLLIIGIVIEAIKSEMNAKN